MQIRLLIVVMAGGMLAGCGTHKQNIMLKPSEGFRPEQINSSMLKANQNYLIKKNDLLALEIYSNGGEKLVDPNPELSQSQVNSNDEKEPTSYLVDINGIAKFPMVGELKVEGLTLRQAELVLQKEFEKFFKGTFVVLKFINKRVVVLGSSGGQVIHLTNETMTLAEILALAKSITNESKAHNIRVLRDTKVFLVDLSTIQGFESGNMIMESGDIVYVEPVRKPIVEGFRDYSFVVTFLASITTLIAIFTR